jgi:hypothetical protein
MIEQNVTSYNQSFYFKIIHLKQIQPNENLTISIHFQIHPLNKNLSYLFIYSFDHLSPMDQFDGWTLFCPLSKSDRLF